jgi:hypothetical protein
MPRLGVLLVRAGAVNEESVNRALAVQGFAGGRLGTLLLERGSAVEDDIGKALAEQHGCQYIPWRVLGSLPPETTVALPSKFAIRHSAVPVELGEGFLRIALRDPANLRILDELFFVTGKKILPATAPEVRLYQALEKYYGERRTPRFAILAEKLSRPIMPQVIKKPLPPPPDFSAPPMRYPGGSVREVPSDDGADQNPFATWKVPDEPGIGWAGQPISPDAVEEDLESIPWEEMPSTGSWPRQRDGGDRRADPPARAASARLENASPWRQAPPAPASAPAASTRPPSAGMPAAADFEGILAARGRDEIFEAALKALADRFPKSAVFAVRPDGVTGWAGSGSRVDAEALRALELPWTEPSIFLNVRMSRAFYLGPLPPLPRHRAMAAALGGWPAECVVQPVLMRDKTVAFFYAECAGPHGATPADLTFARELAGATAAALAASIRLKKKEVI